MGANSQTAKMLRLCACGHTYGQHAHKRGWCPKPGSKSGFQRTLKFRRKP